MGRKTLRAIGIVLLACGAGFSQEFGSIIGIVTDSSGGAVTGTLVTAVNSATGVATRTLTNASGNYALLYLVPGSYSVRAERDGFGTVMRPAIEIRVGDELKLDLQLTVGNVQQSVMVQAQTPLLQAEDANLGATINQAQLADLPLPDGNPFTLTHLVAGAVFTGNPQFTRPFDNGDVSAVRVNGAEGSSEFTINGMPDGAKQSAAGNYVVAFVPPSDAVQEFRMTTSNFSALQGHSAASSVNVSTKSGTNQLHGTAYEFFRNELLSANEFFLNRSGQPRPVVRYNRFGGSLGGPVVVPKAYNGHDKTFFFVAYENLPDTFPEPNTFTVPTAAERQGDFSGLPPANIIYDPLTAAPTISGHIRRAPFTGNLIPPSRLSAIAQNVLQYYPSANQAGQADGTNNFESPQSRTDRFHTALLRVDHVLSSHQKLSGTYYGNWRHEERFNWAGSVNGLRPAGQNLFSMNHGAGLDDVITLSPSTLLEVRGAFTRFESNMDPAAVGFDPGRLGFSAAVIDLFTGPAYLPPFNINGYSRLSHNTGTTLFQALATNVYSFQPTLTKTIRKHTLNLGYDFRNYRENYGSLGNSEGYYDFQDNFTRAGDNTASATGQGLAAFLLGQPTGGSIDRNGRRANQALYHGLFFEDNWRISARLTWNLGLRYEYQGPTTERYNQNTRGFDLTSPNPIAAAATAAFAEAYPDGVVVAPGLPVFTADNLSIRGGYLFASPALRGFWKADPWNLQPRLGLAYQLNDRTVMRGGWAIYGVPVGVAGANLAGFTQSTSLVPSNDNGLTFRADLANPFPDGVLDPFGSRRGLATAVGQNVSFTPLNPKTGREEHWSIDIQRQLPGQWVIDAAYVGSHGYDLSRTTNSLDAIPPQYLSTRPIRDQAAISALTAQVTNPFFGLAPGSSFNTSKTIEAQQLLRPFPEFTQIQTSIYDGTNDFHAGELRVEHRFGQGYAVWATYTWSKLLERYGFLNDFETQPTRRISGNDVPHRVTATFIGLLPFGHGRRFGQQWNTLLNGILGGWQAQGIYQFQSGGPIDLSKSNLMYFGDPSKLRTNISSRSVDQAFDPSGFYFGDAGVQNPQTGAVDPNLQRADKRIQLADNIRTFPAILPGFRQQGQNNIDLSVIKQFPIRERATLQLRGEALNAFNHPWFSAPAVDPTKATFATITSQRNLPREMQVALKLVF